MKTLAQILAQLPISNSREQVAYQQLQQQQQVLDMPFQNWVLDSRQVDTSDAFILLKSSTQSIESSCRYAQSASKKAAFILSEIPKEQLLLADSALSLDCPLVSVPNIRDILGILLQVSLAISASSSKSYVLPKVVAVTGTNGKTTVSQLVAQLYQQPNRQCAVMGTAGNGLLNNLEQATHTTADALAVQQFLQKMAMLNVDMLSLEASSHGLDQQRLQGVPVKVAVYTNLSRDHLDYHDSMEDYAEAKARLFDRHYFPHLTHAIINADDEFAKMMIKRATDSGVTVWTYSINPQDSNKPQATFYAQQITPSLEGTQIELSSDFGVAILYSPLLGRFNVANLLASVAATMALGESLEVITERVKNLCGASGRMQRVPSKQGCFIVDYAHTPDALTQVLSSLKAHCEGKLWAVFGCGGDRDRGKRPLMAQAGLSIADYVILTSDNPRSEEPLQILQDMQEGMTQAQHDKTHVEVDRRQAIAYAVQQAGVQDIVVIAGKGHETYQEIRGVRHNFDDRQVLTQLLASL
ncbi:UDP-N-acetylmuramoyl-L-alanyl-D-glutamate--2,6-diaminopimelate ligase [Psychrobacter sp. I-STPA6b]|uniref:UDP-N-acetylmuramoyl-L-alanyl-D-glutamate--2, 6-diaminopimelate ligase n=1 Tax=Psychrobacter sp. I-STPA6b TaxID=2585718 RepID=UPI001D0C69BF|nr:UDP-N-acetylmuramoyl-L-alanyl-D-glutamate--2,6-diaminopimelate ligase [Psychrobacter sp. I-STPA6b]